MTVRIYNDATNLQVGGDGAANPNFSIALPFTPPPGPAKAIYSLSARAYDRAPVGVATTLPVAIYPYPSSMTALCTPLPPTVSILASPNPVPYNGTTNITWNSPNASACTGVGGSIGWAVPNKAPTGSFSAASLIGATTFTIYCSNDGGDGASAGVTVEVQPPPAPVAVTATQPTNYCGTTNPSADVAWSAETNMYYQVQASTVSNFTSTVFDFENNPLAGRPTPWWRRLLEWTGLLSEADAVVTGQHQVSSSQIVFGGNTYYVRVRVAGKDGKWSLWSAVASFETPLGAGPVPGFTAPQSIFAGLPAQFTDTSSTSPLAPILSWLWELKQGAAVIQTSSEQNAQLSFPSEGDYTVTLSVTNDGGTCSTAGPAIKSGKGLPLFREVRPGSRPTPTAGAN